jgi:dihydrosphingosine 1-phosphate phosphatase
MHGFFDVVIGSLLGILLGVIQCVYGDAFDNYLYSGNLREPVIIILIILVLVRIHPEPADDCPCFDDSVAFAGVVAGIEFGNWHYSRTSFAISSPFPGTVPFDLQKVGWIKTVIRIALGVVTIFAWREIMKPTLLRLLPPLFRVIERLGLSLPRKFFTKASEYNQVPSHLKDDTIIPSMSEFPAIITSIRHPRRRAVSIGPQSAADAYETLAYREKRRRESISSSRALSPVGLRPTVSADGSPPQINIIPAEKPLTNSPSPPTSPTKSKIDAFEHMMGTGSTSAVVSSDAKAGHATSPLNHVNNEQQPFPERDEKEIFDKLMKPRVRYDVEVVTKLIVYSGIAWLAVEGNPILFELIGLGMGKGGKVVWMG